MFASVEKTEDEEKEDIFMQKMKPKCSLPELHTCVVSFNWIRSSNVWMYPYQSKIIAATMRQYCGNIAATHFCYQKPDFETSEMLPLAATTSGNIVAILLECCR